METSRNDQSNSPEIVDAEVLPDPADAAERPVDPEPVRDELISPELAPKLTLDDDQPTAKVAPDLQAVEPEAAPAPARGTNLDLPSIQLPHGADYAEHVARSAYGQPQPQPQQAPPAPAYQTPYAVPQPPVQPQPYPQFGQEQYGQPYGQAPQYGQQLAYSGGQLSAADEATWSGAAHWSAILASFLGLGFVGPLLVLLIQGPKSARVRANAVESLNFEITFVLSMIVSVILIFAVVGLITTFLIPIAWLVLRILASVRTSNGQDYRYPVALRLVK